jgi:hypothetical protein
MLIGRGSPLPTALAAGLGVRPDRCAPARRTLLDPAEWTKRRSACPGASGRGSARLGEIARGSWVALGSPVSSGYRYRFVTAATAQERRETTRSTAHALTMLVFGMAACGVGPKRAVSTMFPQASCLGTRAFRSIAPAPVGLSRRTQFPEGHLGEEDSACQAVGRPHRVVAGHSARWSSGWGSKTAPDCLPCRVPRHLPFLQLSPGQGRGWHPRYALILSTVLGSGAGRSGPRGALLEGSVSLPYSGSGSGCGAGSHGGRWLRLMSRKEAGTAGTTR